MVYTQADNLKKIKTKEQKLRSKPWEIDIKTNKQKSKTRNLLWFAKPRDSEGIASHKQIKMNKIH